jgi:predicted nucleotide-binding protein
MPNVKIFIGSSGAAKSQAKAIVKAFTSATVTFVPWWDEFTPGRTLLGELDKIRGKVNGALLLFSPEAPAVMRGKSIAIPNLNVLFEFGYFYSHFGPQKVAMVKYADFFLPSDLSGYIHIPGSQFFKPNAVAQVGKKTKVAFDKWIAQF